MVAALPKAAAFIFVSNFNLLQGANAFSKKIENLRAAVGLHFAYYNFVRLHKTLRVTPAMAAGVETRLWTLEELVGQASK